MLVSKPLVGHLEARGVAHALIGGVAMAAWGLARFTADLDLLVLDPDILRPDFWEGSGLPTPLLRAGDAEDPLGGVARFALDPPHDLIVGKGRAARVALDRRVRRPSLPCPVADPLGLILLKLEAGAPQDAFDILGLLQAASALGQPGLRQDLLPFLPGLSPEARAFWEKVQGL